MSAPARRLLLVDALRGLAALGVVVYHLGTNDLERPLAGVLSRYVTAAFERGWLGVHVFFALSGFVIAHSIGETPMTWVRAWRFFLRRQVRLDPPYWCTIALGTGLAVYWRAAQPGVPQYVASPATLAAHVLYVYDLLGLQPVNAVFWSLAIEVQFYLAFVLLLALLRRAPRALPWVLAATALGSLHGAMHWAFPHAWGAQHWYLFALGALTRWGLDRRGPAFTAAAFALGYLAAGAHFARLEPVAGGLVALALLVAGRTGGLERWLGARPLQWLGAWSYSVYLLHTIVAGQARWMLNGRFDPHRPAGALMIFSTELAVALLAGWAFHRTVERRAIALAGTIDWKRGRRATPDDTVAPAAARERVGATR